MRIAVCDDEKVFLDTLNNFLTDYFQHQSIVAEIQSFQNPKLLMYSHKESPYDVLFLDIDMPDCSGFDIAEQVRSESNKPFIIFVSSKHSLVYNSFKYTPFYFIRKTDTNVMFNELNVAMSKLLESFKQNRKIEVSDSAFGSNTISIKDIIYIKSEKHYLLYYLNSTFGPPLRERAILSSREIELSGLDFIKTHQRYLINMTHIVRFDIYLNSIVLSNNDIVPISKKLKDSVIRQYQIFKRK